MILPLAMLRVHEATDGQVHEEVAGDSEVPMDTGSSPQEGAGAEATADDGRTDPNEAPANSSTEGAAQMIWTSDGGTDTNMAPATPGNAAETQPVAAAQPDTSMGAASPAQGSAEKGTDADTVIDRVASPTEPTRTAAARSAGQEGDRDSAKLAGTAAQGDKGQKEVPAVEANKNQARDGIAMVVRHAENVMTLSEAKDKEKYQGTYSIVTLVIKKVLPQESRWAAKDACADR